ncbi:hypothetical protein FHETE_48 [Fusarium heterosporum]|uniref:MARVEL domain-containing protein n=1 Tax=Fusarium heterosporum TaxID=42747 RepID=A0A8H5X521_FUSHE|nr:hypothetical protein FHETE_48 [Fusarium heterosporum]
MDCEKDSDCDSKTSQPQQRPFRKLVLGLRVLALLVTIVGIVVAAIPARRSSIAIGILGPAFVTTFCWSLLELLCSLIRRFHAIRPSFSFAIDGFIALGSLVTLIWFGVYQAWWELDDPSLPNYISAATTEILFKVALGFACVSTATELALCIAWLLE